MTTIFRDPFVWGRHLSAEGKDNNDMTWVPVSSLLSYDRFIDLNDAVWGRAIIYWSHKYQWYPANRRANKILRPIFKSADMPFPRSGARGDAFIRQGKSERYYTYIPQEVATMDQCWEWAEGNLTPHSYSVQEAFDTLDQWLLILGDDENDHLKARMRWG